MCRHLAYLGPPIALADLLFDAPHSLARQARAPAPPDLGHDQPRRVGRRLVRRRRHRAEPVPHRHPDLGRRRVRRRARDLRSGAFLAAARCASPGATCRHRQRAVRRRPLAVLAQRRSCTASPTASATSSARAASRRRALAGSRATPTPRCCSRSCSTASTRRARPATRCRASSATVARHHHRPRSTCCSPTAPRSRPRGRELAVRARGDPSSWRRSRSTTTPGWTEVPDRLARHADASPRHAHD